MKHHQLDVFTETPLLKLQREANRVCRERFGNEIEFCAIVNAKNGRCSMDCRFCAQSIYGYAPIEAYPFLNRDSLVDQTQALWRRGIRRVGWVISGCAASDDEIDNIVAARCHGGLLCASLGQINRSAFYRLREAGFTRYHHNLETSEAFYPSICSTQRWSDRLETVRQAKSLGFEICCGGVFGLGETWKDRYDLAMVLRNLDADSVPVNFLTPIPGTPFAGHQVLSAGEALRIIAMLRLLLPNATIRVCGGRPAIFGKCLEEVLGSGANALMTGDYLTTEGISPENDRQMAVQSGFDIVPPLPPREGYPNAADDRSLNQNPSSNR